MNSVEGIQRPCLDPAVLDRLVDGELDGEAHGALLRQLDQEPDGWKRCALAFLEAQAWEDSISAGATEATSCPQQPSPSRRHAMVRQMAGMAAAIAIAFCVGFVSRGSRAGEQNGARDNRVVVRVAENLSPGGASADLAASPELTATASAVPEYLRRRMERQGYRIGGDRRIVPVALEDGRKVAVPVETVSLRYVGQRIH